MKQYLATVLNLTSVYNLSSGKFGHGICCVLKQSTDFLFVYTCMSKYQKYRYFGIFPGISVFSVY